MTGSQALRAMHMCTREERSPTMSVPLRAPASSAPQVYVGKPASFSTDSRIATYAGVGSYVLNPFEVQPLCAYGGDGATRGKICQPPGVSSKCIPACMPQYDSATGDSANEYDAWCGGGDYYCGGRPWRPSTIGQMLEADRAAVARHEPRDEHHSYNEIVIDGLAYNRNLPRGVEAFVLGTTDDLAKAREVHQRFLGAYGLSAVEVPLLRFRPERHGEPFTPV